MNDHINGNAGGNGDETWLSTLSLRPLASADMLGCRNGKIPAFLTKTFNIVNDPNTNSIISWSSFGNTFIIWDHLKFSVDVLPVYFRHSNFSSFIYQLNNYGFRKVGVEHQWEYENVNFQAGKEYLLANMRRRNQIPGRVVTRRWKRRALCDNTNGMEILPGIVNELKVEITSLKMRQTEMELEILALEIEVRRSEKQLNKVNKCLAKACDDAKKRKVDSEKSDATNPEPVDDNDDDDGSNLNPQPEAKSGQATFWEKLLLEDIDEVCVTESEGAEIENKQAKMAMDLECLIGKLFDDQDTQAIVDVP